MTKPRADYAVHFSRDGAYRIAKFSDYSDALAFGLAESANGRVSHLTCRWRPAGVGVASFLDGRAVSVAADPRPTARKRRPRRFIAKSYEAAVMRALKAGEAARRVKGEWYVGTVECTSIVLRLDAAGRIDRSSGAARLTGY